MRLFRPATIQVPTPIGWLVLALLALVPPTIWALFGEQFLAVQKPVEADVLVVEGWIGRDGVEFAASVFKEGNYRYAVSVGLESDGWRPIDKLNFAAAGAHVLASCGVPKERILEVPLQRLPLNRSATSAEAVREVLREAGIQPKGLNIVSKGSHTRRSRLVLTDAFPDVPVGSYAFRRAYMGETRWWHSTDRSKEFLAESALYVIQRARSTF